jgi:hypothetical protein
LFLKNLYESGGFRDLRSTGVFSDIHFETTTNHNSSGFDTRNGIAQKLKQMESIFLTVD